MGSREKKGGSGGSRKKSASSSRDAAADTQVSHPSATPPPWTSQAGASSTRPPLQRVNASFWPELGGEIHGGQSTSSTNQWAGYINLLQQPLLPIGESSHFVGVGKSMNPPFPAPTPPGRVTIDIDYGVEVNRGVKKRFWSHDEEVRLASVWLNTSNERPNSWQ